MHHRSSGSGSAGGGGSGSGVGILRLSTATNSGGSSSNGNASVNPPAAPARRTGKSLGVRKQHNTAALQQGGAGTGANASSGARYALTLSNTQQKQGITAFFKPGGKQHTQPRAGGVLASLTNLTNSQPQSQHQKPGSQPPVKPSQSHHRPPTQLPDTMSCSPTNEASLSSNPGRALSFQSQDSVMACEKENNIHASTTTTTTTAASNVPIHMQWSSAWDDTPPDCPPNPSLPLASSRSRNQPPTQLCKAPRKVARSQRSLMPLPAPPLAPHDLDDEEDQDDGMGETRSSGSGSDGGLLPFRLNLCSQSSSQGSTSASGSGTNHAQRNLGFGGGGGGGMDSLSLDMPSLPAAAASPSNNSAAAPDIACIPPPVVSPARNMSTCEGLVIEASQQSQLEGDNGEEDEDHDGEDGVSCASTPRLAASPTVGASDDAAIPPLELPTGPATDFRAFNAALQKQQHAPTTSVASNPFSNTRPLPSSVTPSLSCSPPSLPSHTTAAPSSRAVVMARVVSSSSNVERAYDEEMPPPPTTTFTADRKPLFRSHSVRLSQRQQRQQDNASNTIMAGTQPAMAVATVAAAPSRSGSISSNGLPPRPSFTQTQLNFSQGATSRPGSRSQSRSRSNSLSGKGGSGGSFMHGSHSQAMQLSSQDFPMMICSASQPAARSSSAGAGSGNGPGGFYPTTFAAVVANSSGSQSLSQQQQQQHQLQMFQAQQLQQHAFQQLSQTQTYNMPSSCSLDSAPGAPMASSSSAAAGVFGSDGRSLSGSNSIFYCTPQDQPIRPRTAFEMSEALQLAREGQQYRLAQQAQMQMATMIGQDGQISPSQHQQQQQMSISRQGTNTSSGITAPPIKKARNARGGGIQLHLTASQYFLPQNQHDSTSTSISTHGLESMQVLGTTLPGGVDAMPLQHHLQPQKLMNFDNPFLLAYDPQVPPAVDQSNGPSSNAASSRAAGKSKKRPMDSNIGSSCLTTTVTSRMHQDFLVLRPLSSGCYGEVFLARHRLTGIRYAIKRCKRYMRGMKSSALMLREVQLLAYVDTLSSRPRSIVKSLACWVEDGQLYHQMELCPGGSLTDVMRRFWEKEKEKEKEKDRNKEKDKHGHVDDDVIPNGPPPRDEDSRLSSCAPHPFPPDILESIALQLGEALAFLHQNKLVHLDVKPDNILLFSPAQYPLPTHDSSSSSLSSSSATAAAASSSSSSPLTFSPPQSSSLDARSFEIRLGDFGLACSSSDGSSPSLSVGDKRYLSPEALDEDIADLMALDLFAFGVTMYELACGKAFEQPMSEWAMTKIRHGDVDECEEHVSPLLFHIIRSLLHPEPNQRPSAAQVVTALQQQMRENGTYP